MKPSAARPDYILFLYSPHAAEGRDHHSRRLEERFPKGSRFGHYHPTTVQDLRAVVRQTLARGYYHPLFVAVGGDGSYNVDLTAVMEFKDDFPECRPRVAVLPAGSANDHVRAVFGHNMDSMRQLIACGGSQPMDLIQVQLITGQTQRTLYAHSYVGLGQTADASEVCHNATLPQQVMRSVITLYRSQTFRLQYRGQERTYQHWSVHNVGLMARYFRTPGARLSNGTLERRIVLAALRWNRSRLLWLGVKAVVGRGPAKTVKHQEFTVLDPVAIQWDGETRYRGAIGPLILEPGTVVKVSCLHHAIDTIAA